MTYMRHEDGAYLVGVQMDDWASAHSLHPHVRHGLHGLGRH